MLGPPYFLQQVRSTTCNLARVYAVIMATGLVTEQGLKNVFCRLKKIQSLDFFHYLPTKNAHKNHSYQLCSNKTLTETVFVIGRKWFSPHVLYYENSHCQDSDFFYRLFTYFLMNHIFAKFLEIPTIGSFEIGRFLQKHITFTFTSRSEYKTLVE